MCGVELGWGTTFLDHTVVQLVVVYFSWGPLCGVMGGVGLDWGWLSWISGSAARGLLHLRAFVCVAGLLCVALPGDCFLGSTVLLLLGCFSRGPFVCLLPLCVVLDLAGGLLSWISGSAGCCQLLFNCGPLCGMRVAQRFD